MVISSLFQFIVFACLAKFQRYTHTHTPWLKNKKKKPLHNLKDFSLLVSDQTWHVVHTKHTVYYWSTSIAKHTFYHQSTFRAKHIFYHWSTTIAIFMFCFEGRVLLWSPHLPRTCNPPASISQVLRLQTWETCLPAQGTLKLSANSFPVCKPLILFFEGVTLSFSAVCIFWHKWRTTLTHFTLVLA